MNVDLLKRTIFIHEEMFRESKKAYIMYISGVDPSHIPGIPECGCHFQILYKIVCNIFVSSDWGQWWIQGVG